MIHKLCPNCQYNLEDDTFTVRELIVGSIITLEGWEIDPQGDTYCNGKLMDLTRTEASILQCLARAGGRDVTYEELMAWTNSRGRIDSISVMTSKITVKCRRAGVRSPIKNAKGIGYRWAKENRNGRRNAPHPDRRA